MNKGFSVLDMANDIAHDEDIDVEGLFAHTSGKLEELKAKEAGNNVSSDDENFTVRPADLRNKDASFPKFDLPPQGVIQEAPAQSQIGPPTGSDKAASKKKPWVPAVDLSDMPEMNSAPLTYAKDEIRTANDTTEMKNVQDDVAAEQALQTMDHQTRIHTNIESVKKRFGIKHCQIPEGQFHASITAAAGDNDYKRSRAELDKIFEDIVKNYPEFVKEWIDPTNNPHANKTNVVPFEGANSIIDIPDNLPANDPRHPAMKEDQAIQNVEENRTAAPPMAPPISSGEDLKVVLNKTQLPEVSWSQEEVDKIRRSRTVELNIQEDMTLKYTQIEEADDNTVDAVLSQYVRKVNDVPGALPASKYRATFTGLTYTEVLDLTHSQEMNNLDGERKKWSIAYDHTKNPSIGNFKDFNDFLKKTSFMDLEYILWKILCATAQDNEIISIDCHGEMNSLPCRKSYDWIYSPASLLDVKTISPVILEEMKKTAEANSPDSIADNYKESMLNTNNTVELPTSKFGLVFGHISAYDFLNNVYAEIQNLQEQENTMLSQALSHSTLTILKSFLLPNPKGEGHIKVSGVKNLMRVINTLDEIDWQTIGELIRIMIEPYQFSYVLKDIRCPQCKIKSDIKIEDISRMLFILSRSLESVNVTLKRT